MTDQEWMAEIASLLYAVCATHLQLEQLFQAEFDAYTAICKALEKNEERVIPTLQREYNRAYGVTKPVGKSQQNNLEALSSALGEWSSPGQEFARFREEIIHVSNNYNETFNQMAETHKAMRDDLLDLLQ